MKNILNKIFFAVLAGFAVATIVSAATILFPYQGGTGTGTVPVTGGLLIGQSSGVYGGLSPGTSGQVLTSNGVSSLPSWQSIVSGVSSVSNSNGTLTISPTTGAVVSSLNTAHANTWTAKQTFSTSNISVTGGSNGQFLQTDGSGNLSWASGGSSGWSLSGNAGTSGAVLGTTDNQSWGIQADGQREIGVYPGGLLLFDTGDEIIFNAYQGTNSGVLATAGNSGNLIALSGNGFPTNGGAIPYSLWNGGASNSLDLYYDTVLKELGVGTNGAATAAGDFRSHTFTVPAPTLSLLAFDFTGSGFNADADGTVITYNLYATENIGPGAVYSSPSSNTLTEDFNATSLTNSENGGAGSTYIANGQSMNYTVYALFNGKSGSVPATTTFTDTINDGSTNFTVTLNWSAPAGTASPDNYLVVNTTLNNAVMVAGNVLTATDDGTWSSAPSTPGAISFNLTMHLTAANPDNYRIIAQNPAGHNYVENIDLTYPGANYSFTDDNTLWGGTGTVTPTSYTTLGIYTNGNAQVDGTLTVGSTSSFGGNMAVTGDVNASGSLYAGNRKLADAGGNLYVMATGNALTDGMGDLLLQHNTLDSTGGSPTSGQILGVNGSNYPVWESLSTAGAVPTSRTITAGTGLSGGGDLSANRTLSLNVGNANTWSAKQTFSTSTISITGGSNGQFLKTDGSGNVSWATSSGGMTNPMTTTGDTIYSSDNSGTPARLGIGSTGQIYTVVSGIPAWATYTGSSSLVTTGTISSGTWHGTKIGLAYGGTNADLSATGGTSQVLEQTSVGGTITVGQLAASDLSNGTTGSGSVVLATSPTLTTASLGSSTATTQSASDNSTKVATTAYVTTGIANAIAGVNPAIAVKYATTAAADTSGLTYSNGVSGIGATMTGANNATTTFDGHTFVVGDVGVTRVLIKNDTQSPSGAFNGVYLFTALHTSITGDIFTRALDYDTPSDINNTGAIPVVSGTANATTSWLLTSLITTVGTDPLTYTQFSRSPTSVLPANLGGTGIANNASSTLTISGSFGTTFTVSATTAVTLPTSGTLYGTASGSITSSQLLTSLSDATGTGAAVFGTSPSLTTPTLGVASATSINKVTITAPVTSATLTIANGKTATISNTLTFTGTDSSSVAFGAGGTVAYTNVATLSSLTTTGTITSGGLGTGAVIGGVTMTLGSDANYDMYYRNSSGVLTRLANGTTGQVLTATTSAAPSWAAATSPSTASGVTTYAMSTASGVQTIAHGLGRTPVYVKITAVNTDNNNAGSSSYGSYNGTTTSAVYWAQNTSGYAGISGSSSTNVIFLVNKDGQQVATITVDSTNINLTWTKTSAPTGTARIMWEVY